VLTVSAGSAVGIPSIPSVSIAPGEAEEDGVIVGVAASGAGEGDGAIGGVDAVVVAGAAVGLRVGTEACDGSPVATGAKVGTVVEFGEGSAPIEGFAVGS